MSSSKDTFDYEGKPVRLVRNMQATSGVCDFCPIGKAKAWESCEGMRATARKNGVENCGPGATALHWDFYVYSDDDNVLRALLAGDLIRG